MGSVCPSFSPEDRVINRKNVIQSFKVDRAARTIQSQSIIIESLWLFSPCFEDIEENPAEVSVY